MTLFLVPTPIGNLQDMTYRAVQVLTEVDYILAEDTRNSIHLLKHYNINTPLKSYHDFNKEKIEGSVISDLTAGLNVGLISDAGMPLISDPGYELVRRCRMENISVTPLPGANAALTALIGSGLPSFQFMFLGFIPKKKNEKFEVIKSALESDKTSIFYESPYRIKSTIELIAELEEDRDISIGRELTKKFEQIEHGLSSDLLKKMNDGEIKEKGEFVLIISPGDTNISTEYDMSIEDHVNLIIDQEGIKPKKAIKEVARLRDMKASEVYDIYHQV